MGFERGRLQRQLGVFDATVVGVGSMVGAGVFVVWSPAGRAAGNGLLIGLLVAALVAACNALSSAQLAAIHPESGGTYVYARRQLGSAWGHLAGWGFVVGKTASCAAIALAAGAYLWPDRPRAVAVPAVAGVTLLNLAGLSRTVTVTKALLVISLTTLAIAVVSGWTVEEASLDRLAPVRAGVTDVLQSAGFIFFAFAGYARIATLGEEVKRPEHTIPRAIPLALAIVLAIYAVVGATVLAATPPDSLGSDPAPLRSLVEAARWDALAPSVQVGAGLASLGVLLNLVPGVSRTVLAMARRSELPSGLAQVDTRRKAPVRAELTVGATVLLLVAVLEIRSAIAVSGVAVLTYYAITNLAALTLTPAQRRWPRPLAVVGLAGCLVLVVTLPLRALVIGGVAIAAGAAARGVLVGRRGNVDESERFDAGSLTQE